MFSRRFARAALFRCTTCAKLPEFYEMAAARAQSEDRTIAKTIEQVVEECCEDRNRPPPETRKTAAPQSRDPGQVGVADLEQEFLSGTKDSAETEKSEQSAEIAQSKLPSPLPAVPHGTVLPDPSEPSARELPDAPAALTESDGTLLPDPPPQSSSHRSRRSATTIA